MLGGITTDIQTAVALVNSRVNLLRLSFWLEKIKKFHGEHS